MKGVKRKLHPGEGEGHAAAADGDEDTHARKRTLQSLSVQYGAETPTAPPAGKPLMRYCLVPVSLDLRVDPVTYEAAPSIVLPRLGDRVLSKTDIEETFHVKEERLSFVSREHLKISTELNSDGIVKCIVKSLATNHVSVRRSLQACYAAMGVNGDTPADPLGLELLCKDAEVEILPGDHLHVLHHFEGPPCEAMTFQLRGLGPCFSPPDALMTSADSTSSGDSFKASSVACTPVRPAACAWAEGMFTPVISRIRTSAASMWQSTVVAERQGS